MRRKGNNEGEKICQRKQEDDFGRTKKWERRGCRTMEDIQSQDGSGGGEKPWEKPWVELRGGT